MKTKIALSVAVLVGFGSLGACDGGTADGAGGTDGDDATTGGTNTGTGGYSEGSGGTTPSTGGAAGGEGGGGGAPSELGEVESFCDEYEDTNEGDGFDCGFDPEDEDRYASREDCLETAGEVAEANPDRFACFVSHLGYVNSEVDTDHCAHAHGATLCSEEAYPLP